MSAPREPIRVVRVIARLNVGGPAIQAITLTHRLHERGYETTLVRGTEEPNEGSLDDLAAERGVVPLLVPALGRQLGPGDAQALVDLVRLMRTVRPHLVHTHAAKAGTLGRVAAIVSRTSPRLVHTFHGHVLEGYFSPRRSDAFRRVERALARHTDRIVAVSPEVRADLIRLRVVDPEQVVVVPLGFDLRPFVLDEAERLERRRRLRRELGLPDDARVVTLIARLVPIKRVDRFLRIAARVRSPGTRFLVVGDGELRDSLRAAPEAKALGERLAWAGLRRDIPDVCAASDVVVLTSDNEGTPVSLIEAQAAGVPVISTAVGGVPSVVMDGQTGWIVPCSDEGAFATAIDAALALPDRSTFGARGRAHVLARFGLDRLVDDIDHLYRAVLRAP